MLIKDKMTKCIISADINSKIKDIAKLMKEYDIGFIPVHENYKIMGIITDRDIVVNCVFNSDNNIKDYITKNIISIDGNKNLENALDVMKQHKIKRLLVTNENKVTGIISLSDMLDEINSNTLKETLKEIYSIDKNNHDFNSDVDNFYLEQR